MTPYSCMNRNELEQAYQTALNDFDRVKALGLKWDMSRGKPSKAQLDMVSDILTQVQTAADCIERIFRCENRSDFCQSAEGGHLSQIQ